MNRASPTDMRKAFEMANTLMHAGILFVPMPVADLAERDIRVEEAAERLEKMAQDAEQQGGAA